MTSSCCSSLKQEFASLFRRRPLYSSQSILETPLKRCLKLYHVVFYGLSFMMGAGIYVLSGKIISTDAGPAACLSFLLAGIAVSVTALIYAEWGTLIPRSGSTYVYTFLTLGELPAFILGWITISDSLVAFSIVAKSFSATVDIIANGAISNWTFTHIGQLTTSSEGFLSQTPDLFACGLILVIGIIVATGASSSMTVNAAICGTQILCLITIIIACFIYGSPELISSMPGGFAPYGVYGIINGSSIAIFAYSGFDSITRILEEVENPVRIVPRAILIVTFTAICLYTLASLGLAYLVPRDLIDIASPFVSGFKDKGITWMFVVSSVSTILGTGAGKLTNVFSLPRSFYAMGDDGLIFRCFAYVDKVFFVPQISLLVTVVLAMVFAVFFRIEELANIVSLGYVMSYITVGVDLLILRYVLTEDQVESDVHDNVDRPLMLSDISRAPMRLRKPFTGIGERFPMIHQPSCFIALVVLHVIITFGFAIFIAYGIQTSYALVQMLGILLGVCWICSVFALAIYRPTYNNNVYQSPLMPAAPVISMFINSIMFFRIPLMSFLRFIIWSSAGLVIYFTYGRKNSVAFEGKKSREEYATLPDSVSENYNEEMKLCQTMKIN